MAEKKRQRKLPEGGALTALMIVTWVTYFSLYLGRLNFSACMSDMIGNGGFSKAELGIVPAAFFCSYGFGQFLSGLLGDRLPPSTWCLRAFCARPSSTLPSPSARPFPSWRPPGL